MKKALAESLKSLKRSKQEPKPSILPKSPESLPKSQTQLKRTQSSSSVSVIASANLFSGLNFCFPLEDMDLSSEVIQILKKRILKHGGKLFNVGDALALNKTYYYLVSPKVSKAKLSKAVDSDDLYYCCLNYHFINDCLSEDSVLSEDQYWVSSLQSAESKKGKGTKQTKASFKRDVPQNAYTKPTTKKLKTSTSSKLLEELTDLKSMSQEDPPIDSSKKKKNEEYWDQKKDKSLCQKGAPVKGEIKANNAMIMEELKKLQKIYEIEKDKGRVIAYTKAISVIKGLDFEIKDANDVNNIEGIGKKLIAKIQELLETGKLHKVEELQKNQKYQISEEFERVWGIGPTKAVELYKKGIKSIQELRKHEDLLNKNQKIGLKYLQEFQQRIPRKQVKQVQDLVRKTLHQLVGSKTLHKLQACGSYRRGKQTCGDIDIIITRIDGVYEKNLLTDLIQKLEEIGLITDVLTMPGKHKEESSLTFMGVYQLDGKPHRRIDMKYYPMEQFAFAILYFTGSDLFNRSMRLIAKKQGYSLSDHGMVPVDSAGKQKKGSKKIACLQEKDIFDFLGMEYKEPKERDA